MPGAICSVAICKSNSIKAKQSGENLMFFTFPKDPKVRKNWIKNCRRKDKFSAENKRICSKHFKDEDYEDVMRARLMGSQPKRLKKTAIPSLYLFSTIESIEPDKKAKTMLRRKKKPQQKEKNMLENLLSSAPCKNEPDFVEPATTERQDQETTEFLFFRNIKQEIL